MRLPPLALAVALCASVALPAAAETLRVYNFSDYIGETTLADFTKETGIEVVYDVYDSNEVLEAKMLTGGSGYDIVVPTSQPYFARQLAAGAFQPIDAAKVPNLKNLDPKLTASFVASADPEGGHGAIYQWGTNGIGYNTAKVKERLGEVPVDSWAIVFDPANAAKLADCGITLLDSAAEIYPLALNYLGLDPNSQDREDLAKATALLEAVRPHVRYFHSSSYINDLANGEVCVSVGWSGDIGQAATRAEEAGNGVDIAYAIPKEGTLLWFDLMAIPKDAPNPEAAHKFIDFVLRPAVMAGISDNVAYANAVPASWPLMDQEVRNDPGVFPAEETMAKLFVATPIAPAFERERTRAWQRVRGG